jgi:accessory colonization factor AcfC
MVIFKKIFRKKKQKDIQSKSKLKDKPEVQSQAKKKAKKIKLDDLADINVEEVILAIKKKKQKNISTFEENYAKAVELMGQGKAKKAQDLTTQDVIGYYDIYAKANKLEEEGKLEDAAKIYWKNIYENGTDAPANFKRLLIVLSKIGRKKEELSVAKIYSAFVKEKDREKLERRITKIKKKLNSNH